MAETKGTRKTTSTRKATNAPKKEAPPKEETPVKDPVATKAENAEEPKNVDESKPEDVEVGNTPAEQGQAVEDDLPETPKDPDGGEGTPYVELDPNRYPEFFRPGRTVYTTGTPQDMYDSIHSSSGAFQRKGGDTAGRPTKLRKVYRKPKE